MRTFDFRYNADKQAYLEEACARFTNLKTEVIATYVNSTAATLRGELEKRLIPAASRLVQAQILDLLLDSLNGTAKVRIAITTLIYSVFIPSEYAAMLR